MKTTRTIFLAEDDEDDASFFKDAISALADVALTVVENGEKLMNELETNETLPDIIFLDLNMPGKDGFQCLKEIKDNAAWKAIKTVVLSTTSDNTQITKCYSLGADIFVTKVADQREFKSNIKRCLL